MTLGQKRTRFTRMILLLLEYLDFMGYEVRFDREHCNHMEKSLHYEGLAKDLLFFKNGVYLTKSSDYETAGLFWESIGGTWGGRWDDGNHFSVSHGGRK